MTDLVRDFRFGLRMLSKRPGTSALAVIALALGIGLTTAMFSIVNGVFLRGLPFDQADRILYIGATNTKDPGRPNAMPIQDFLDLRAAQGVFEELAAFSSVRADVGGLDGVPVRYSGTRLTPNALEVLRVRPFLGRGFQEADALPGASRVALISHAAWSVQFNGDPDILQKIVRINSEPTAIVGVMPQRFGFPASSSVWLPQPIATAAARDKGPRVGVFGRVREGVTIAQANHELSLVAERFAAQYPENKDQMLAAMPFLRRFIANEIISLLSAMLVAVFGVLLIACVNVTNLQLARASERTKEVAVRLAIGGSRWRIVRQMLCEGLIISAIGVIAGLALAQVGVIFINRGVAIDDTPPFWIDIRLDGTVLAFATALGVFAAIASTLVPALRVTRGALSTVLNDDSRGATSLKVGRFSRGLVVVQMTLSFSLLLASGLIVKSISAIDTVVLPFRPDVLAARLDLTGPEYQDDTKLRQVLERIHARVSGGAFDGATFGSGLPSLGEDSTVVQPEGQTLEAGGSRAARVEQIAVSQDYFRVMRIPLLRGREFQPADRIGSTPVAIVTQEFGDRYLAGADPIGRRFRVNVDEATPVWLTIVGVTPRAVNTARDGVAASTVFVPLDQFPARVLDLLVTSPSDPLTHGAAVRRAVADIDPAIGVFDINTGQGRLDRITWPVHVFGSLFATFGAAALVLACGGLYGVMAFAVRRRTQEIGVRIALGATPSNIRRMVLTQGLGLLVVGVILGIGAGLFLATLLTQLLFQVQPWDPAVLAGTLAILMAAGIMACLVPARRAAIVDPLVALRRD